MALAARAYTWEPNPDGTVDGHYPTGNKNPNVATAAWDNVALQLGLAVAIAQRTTGSSFSHDLRQYLTGSAAATATLSVATVSGDDAASEGWAISGDNLTHPGSGTGAGFLKVGATVSGNTVYSNPMAWAWVGAITDTLAPCIPTGGQVIEGSGALTFSCDIPGDPHDGTAAGAMSAVQLRIGGSTQEEIAVGAGLSPAWALTNIGSSTPSPSFGQTGADWAISGGGAGFDGTTDQFPFNQATLSGDFKLNCKVTSFTSAVSSFSKLGLMVRESTTAGARLLAIYYMASIGRVQIKTRIAIGGSSTSQSGVDVVLPLWLQIERAADVFTARYSVDGITWTDFYTTTLAMSPDVAAGAFVTSQSNGNAVSGGITQLSTSNSGRVTFTPISTAVAKTVKFRAKDAAGNLSAESAAITGTPLTGVEQVKWHPQHGMIINGFWTASSSGYTASHITDLSSEPNIGFIVHRIYWVVLEPTQGQYDFSAIETLLTLCASVGKKLIVQLQDRTFSGTSYTIYLPAYLTTLTNGEGGIHIKGNGGVVAKYWIPAVMDRYIALLQAMAAHSFGGYTLDTHPYLEGITNCESSAPSQPVPSDWTAGGAAAQLKRWMSGAVAAFPHMNTFCSLNYLSNQMESLVAYAASVRCGIGGPDTVPNAPTAAQRVFMGLHEDGSAGGIDYRGQIPAFFQVQGPELGGKEGTFTMSAIGTAGATYGANFMPWLRTTQAAPKPNWATDIQPYLHGTPQALATTCPLTFPACNTA